VKEVAYRGSNGNTRTITSEIGQFIAYNFTLKNSSESSREPLPDSVFTLAIDGETLEHIHSFPGGVKFRDIEQEESEPQIRPLAWYDTLQPGEGVSLQLVFEAPVKPEYRPYLVWDHGSEVAASTDPVYLRPSNN